LQVRSIAAPVATEDAESPITFIQDVKAEVLKLQQTVEDDDSANAKSIQQLQEQMKKIEENQAQVMKHMEQMNAALHDLLKFQRPASATEAGKT
jgi:DNA repair exonuclease SbcCD ATPase subunit